MLQRLYVMLKNLKFINDDVLKNSPIQVYPHPQSIEKRMV